MQRYSTKIVEKNGNHDIIAHAFYLLYSENYFIAQRPGVLIVITDNRNQIQCTTSYVNAPRVDNQLLSSKMVINQFKLIVDT